MTTPRREWMFPCLAYGTPAILALTLGYMLLRLPIQVTESLPSMLALGRSTGDLMQASVQEGYLRPAMWAELKLVHTLSQGNYFTWFRWTQVLQTGAVLAAFVWLVRPRTAADAMVMPLALAVLVGHHTIAWTLREAFPINTYLTIVICCAIAANLSFAPHRWWTDAAAVLLFAVSAATVESGLLVGGIFIVGYLLGLRGVSGRGLVVVLGLIALYFVLRFVVLRVGVPTLLARDAGFGFHRYDAVQINQMFGAGAVGFYAYNVVVSVVGLLFAEPRDGVFALTRSLVQGAPSLPLLIGFLSSTLATALIVRFAWIRRHVWRRWELERRDQLVLMFLGVAAGNAAISYAYTKDTIMSPAGFLYAAAVFVACVDLVERLGAVGSPAREGRSRGGWVQAAGLAVLLVLSITWSIRMVGLHAALAHTSYKVREEWAHVDEMLKRLGYVPVPRDVAAITRQLQDDAIVVHPGTQDLREELVTLFEVD